MKPDKRLYRGTFNWQGESMVLHGWFKNENHAFFILVGRMARKVQVSYQTAYCYFASETRDGYLIERVKEKN